MNPTQTAVSSVMLSGVCATIDGREILHDVDLDASTGTLTVITGPNGAGKSTLLEVIAGTRIPASGVRTVTGAMAFVPQRAAIPPRLPVSVRDVVSVGAWGRLGPWRRMDPRAAQRVDDSLHRLDIGSLAARSYSSLSGGQQQRALLAQGLAREADLLLLDEPTTGLDSVSSRCIRAVLRDEATRGGVVLCVSHDPTVIADGDVVVRLVDGRVHSE